MKKMKGKRTAIGVLTAAIALLAGTAAHAVDYHWDNGAGDNNFTNPVNWVGDMLPTNAARNKMIINSNGADRAILSGGEIFNFSPLQVGTSGYGEFEQTDGYLNATFNQNDPSLVGLNDGNIGRVTLSGGTARFNTLRVGRNAGSTGYLTIDGCGVTLTKVKGDQNSSLEIGSTGTGTVVIAAGSLNARQGILVGSKGSLSVVGSGTTGISLGGNSIGKYTQLEDGVLDLQIDSGGLTPIVVGNNGAATFASNSILNVSFLGGHEETNAWLVMEAVTGITDSGLTLAPGVDPQWDFEVLDYPLSDKDLLVVTYGGASYPLPSAVTNMYVDAVEPMGDTWTLFAPEGGSTALSNQSSSGFVATIDTVNDWLLRPVVAQEFPNELGISEVGQAVNVSFDVELLNTVDVPKDVDFRFAFYDTNQNCQIITGMIDLGVPSGATMKTRIGENVSLSDTNTFQFVPGDYADLCNGSVTLGETRDLYPGNGLHLAGDVIHMETSVNRTSSNEVGMVTTWSIGGTNGVTTCIHGINELAPADPDGMPPSGKYDVINGFGFKMFDNQPFGAISVGSYKISNFKLSTTTGLPEGFSYNVSGITVLPSGDVMLTLSDPVVGATYEVVGTVSLLPVSWDPIGSYVAEAPGIITIPAVDAASYKFFDVALPVDLVVEVVE